MADARTDINTTALAYLGDAVYEIYVRGHVLKTGQCNADVLHKMAIKFVRAEGQAKALKHIFDTLTEEEQQLVKRARNRKTISKPRNADPVDYKLATAFEALLGWLYLDKQTGRLEAIISEAIAAIENHKEE